MLPYHLAKARALRHAIETGLLAEMDLIHSIQSQEGHEPCFGRMENHCPQTQCRWHAECMALAGYTPCESELAAV